MSMKRLIERLEEARGKSNYTVVIGFDDDVIAYDGSSLSQARQVYAKYVRASESGLGRYADEKVTLMDGNNIIDQHYPDNSDRPDENELGLDDPMMRER